MLELAIRIAGIGMLSLYFANRAAPKLLGWAEQLAAVRPLTRQIFWTYAAYISSTNSLMGLLCLFGPSWLLDGSGLAIAVSSYIFVYWAARILVQFTYYDRTDVPKGALTTYGEVYLVGSFAYWTGLFAYVIYSNVVG